MNWHIFNSKDYRLLFYDSASNKVDTRVVICKFTRIISFLLLSNLLLSCKGVDNEEDTEIVEFSFRFYFFEFFIIHWQFHSSLTKFQQPTASAQF